MDDIKNGSEFCNTIFTATEEALQTWDFKSNLLFPELLKMTQSRLTHFTSDDLEEVDPVMRMYVRRHSKYCSQRGAKGGIGLKSVKLAKETAKAAKDAARAEVKAKLEAKLAAQSSVDTVVAAE